MKGLGAAMLKTATSRRIQDTRMARSKDAKGTATLDSYALIHPPACHHGTVLDLVCLLSVQS